MNSPGSAVAVFASLFFAATSLARGAVIVAEGFDYGPLAATVDSGLNGGLGFNGGWADSFPGGPTPYQYTPVGLTFAGLTTSGGAVTSPRTDFPTTSASITRNFAVVTPAAGYGSYLLQPIGMFTTAGVAFRGAFDFGRTTLGFNAPAQGLGGLVGGAAYAGTTTGQNGSALISGQTYLQIFKYQRSGGSYAAMEWLLSESQFATFKASGLTEQELNLALIGTGPTNVWSRVSVNGLSTGGIEQVTFASQSGFGIDPKGIIQDELRISNTSIDDATPAIVPEPAAFALSCSGILCLVRHRRPAREAQRATRKGAQMDPPP